MAANEIESPPFFPIHVGNFAKFLEILPLLIMCQGPIQRGRQ